MNRRSLLHGVLASLIAPRALGHPGGTKENESIGPFGTPLPATEIPATDRCPGVTRHVNTGFEELDSLLGELRDGRLVAISGRPSMGKTSLALAIAAHVTARVRLPVAIFGAPLSDQEIRALMIGFLARVDPWQAKLLLAGATARSATHAAQILASAPLLIDDRPFLNMEDLRSKIVWNSAQAGLRNGLTVVLAPELLKGESAWPRYQSEHSPLPGALREMSRTLGGAVVCELPLGRAVEERDDKSPRLTDLDGFSREFACDADAILLLYREIVYCLNAEPDVAYVTAARNRFGRRGTIALAFDYAGGFADYRWHGGDGSGR